MCQYVSLNCFPPFSLTLFYLRCVVVVFVIYLFICKHSESIVVRNLSEMCIVRCIRVSLYIDWSWCAPKWGWIITIRSLYTTSYTISASFFSLHLFSVHSYSLCFQPHLNIRYIMYGKRSKNKSMQKLCIYLSHISFSWQQTMRDFFFTFRISFGT